MLSPKRYSKVQGALKLLHGEPAQPSASKQNLYRNRSLYYKHKYLVSRAFIQEINHFFQFAEFYLHYKK